MTLDELEKTREYQVLTKQQRFFIQSYVSGGMIDGHYDAVAAINMSYTCKNDNVARVMSYRQLDNIKIIEVLNRHFGLDPSDTFLTSLDRAVRNKHLTLAQLGALRLKCEVYGFGTKIPHRVEEGFANRPIILPVKLPKKTPKKPKKDKPPVAPSAPLYSMKDFL